MRGFSVSTTRSAWASFVFLAFALVLSACGSGSNQRGTEVSSSGLGQTGLNPTATIRAIIPTEGQITVRGCVTASSLRVRSGPGLEYELVDGLVAGDCVVFNARNTENTWARISNTDNWVSLAYIQSASTIGLQIAQSQVVIPQTSSTKVPQPTSQSSVPLPTVGSTGPIIVDASKANLYIGETVTVRILYSYCEWIPTVEGTFCNDSPFPNHNFTYLAWNVDVTHMNGRCLLITGTVGMFEGKPQIVAGSGVTVYYC